MTHSDRGQNRLFIVALLLALVCAAAAAWVARVAGPAGAGPDTVPGTADAVAAGEDLLIDFTGRPGPTEVPWRVEGAYDSVRRTARGLLVVSRTDNDPPRLVLDLGVPEESFGLLEVTMALNKGSRGRVWGARYAGEPPSNERCRTFALEPGIGAKTYRVVLGLGDRRGAPLHSLNIQLTDAPVRAVVRQVRLLRTAGWRSYLACGSGEESLVTIGGIGALAVPAPESGLLTREAVLPARRPMLHLSMVVHPLQQILGRSETRYRVRVEPLDGAIPAVEPVPVFQWNVDPAQPDQRRWLFHQADLSPWAGRRVRLHLEILNRQRQEGGGEQWALGRPSWALPLWGPLSISGESGTTDPPPKGIVLVLLDGVGQGELGCYGDSGGFPLVSRYFGGAAAVRDAYLVEYGRDRFFESLLHADYLSCRGDQDSTVSSESQVSMLLHRGFRTAAFYSGGVAEDLLNQSSLQAGFELIGRSDFELGVPPAVGDNWLPTNPLFDLPGPLSWLRQLGDEPFFLMVHLDSGGSKASTRAGRLTDIDLAVGRLMACLDTVGRLDHSVICLAGLRGPVRQARVDRGCRLWDESARIPLLVAPPGGSPRAPAPGNIFRSIDILPTLSGLAGVDPGMDGGRAGHSLASWFQDGETGAWPIDEVYLYQQRVGRRYLGLRRGAVKLIWRIEPLDQAACYDLEADPGERSDISPAGPFGRPFHDAPPLGRERYTELVRRLESHFGPSP